MAKIHLLTSRRWGPDVPPGQTREQRERNMDTLPSLDDDGLHTPEVREWAERKYRLIDHYAEMFATSMKDKWASRVYVDLFAGAERGRIKETSRIVATSAFLALGVRDPFDRYVFCDLNPDCIDALRTRVARSYPDRDVRYLTGDANELVERVLEELPRARPGAGVLSFCVLDPFKLSNLRFSTVKHLSAIFVDFLVLIPSYMDANRNERTYVASGNDTLADFLGNPDWRVEWSRARSEFGTFVVDQFGQSMKRLGFVYAGPGDEVPVQLPRKNVKLYHLAFYSRNKLAMKLWRQARKYSNDQMGLFE
jgi:three-Cys-motif partner protein